MSRRDRGTIMDETYEKARQIKRLLRKGLTHEQAGAELGLHQTSVSRLVRRFNLQPPRRSYKPKPAWYFSLPPIDPEKAARITREKMRFWGMEKSA